MTVPVDAIYYYDGGVGNVYVYGRTAPFTKRSGGGAL